MKGKLCLIKALRCSFKDLWRLRWRGDSSRVVLSLRMIIEIWMGLIFTIKLKDWAGYWAGENRWVQSRRNYSTIGHTVHFPSVEQQYQISLRGNGVFSRPLNANNSKWFYTHLWGGVMNKCVKSQRIDAELWDGFIQSSVMTSQSELGDKRPIRAQGERRGRGQQRGTKG